MTPQKVEDRVSIELEIINTPKGDVPTAKSFKNMVNALNILDEEISILRGGFLDQLEDLKKDVKSLKKLIAEETVTLESLNETLKKTSDKLLQMESQKNDALESNIIKSIDEKISSLVKDLDESQKKMEKSFVKALDGMAKVVGMKLNIKKE